MLTLAMDIFAKNPKASLDEVAKKANVGRATLFRYFKNRKQLVRELFEEAGRRVDTVTTPILAENLPAAETLDKIVHVLVPVGASFHFLSTETIQTDDPEMETIFNTQLAFIKNLSARLKAEGVVAQDIPKAWVAAVLDNLIFTAWMTISEGDIAPNDAPELVLTAFLKGFAPR